MSSATRPCVLTHLQTTSLNCPHLKINKVSSHIRNNATNPEGGLDTLIICHAVGGSHDIAKNMRKTILWRKYFTRLSSSKENLGVSYLDTKFQYMLYTCRWTRAKSILQILSQDSVGNLETWIQVWNFSMYTHLLSFLCPKVLSAGAHISVFDEG